MNRQLLADFSLLTVAFIWGVTFVLVQNAISFLPPLTFNAVRFIAASLFLYLILAVFYREQLQAITGKLLGAGIVLGIWLFCGYAFQTIGLLYTTTSKAGFITGLSVVLVPVLGVVFLKQIPKIPTIIGIVVATTGLYLLTLGESYTINLGDFLVLLCAVSFALQIIFTGKYAPNFSALPLALVQISVVGLLSLIGALFFEDWGKAFDAEIIGNTQVLWALIITAVPATAVAFLVQTKSQKFTTPTRVALIFAMEPVFAALAAFLWTDEVLGSKAIAGCVGIFIGMILAELQPEQILSWRKRKTGKYMAS